MPYYFVDGIQAEATAQPLYVQAEDAEAAQTRAKTLGLEPTGVRPAKSLFVPVTADSFRRYLLWMTVPMLLVVMVSDLAQMHFGSKAPSMVGSMSLSIFLALPIVNLLAGSDLPPDAGS